MIERIISVLWEMTLTASWAAGAVFLARLVLNRRAPRRVVCLLWLVVFARLLLPLSLESPLSLMPPALRAGGPIGSVIPAAPSAPPSLADPQGGADLPQGGADLPQGGAGGLPGGAAQSPSPVQGPQPAGTGSAAPAPAGGGSPPAAFPWADLLAGIWLAGAAAMLGYGLASYFRLRRRVRFALRVTGRVWEDENVASPFILGLFRPRIYLPSGLEGRARGLILCHEFAHLRRLDHIVKPLCWLALAVHWFNPAVWAAYLLLSRDMEAACDEAVLRSLGEEVKADYSYTLLSLASGGRIPAPCPIAFDEGNAGGRIRNVLNYRRPAVWIVAVSVLAAAAAAVCLLTDPVTAKDGDGSGPDAPLSQTGDPSPAQSPESGTAPDVLTGPWMLEVLKGERTFSIYGKDWDIGHLAEVFFGEEPENLGLTFRLAVLDLDGDGASELVLRPEGAYDNTLIYQTGYMILRQEGDTVRGYAPGWRFVGDLRSDGTFRWSSSAFYNGSGRARFDGGEFSLEQISWCDFSEGKQDCFVEGQPATAEEYISAAEAQDAKPGPAWYIFENGVLVPQELPDQSIRPIGSIPPAPDSLDEAWKNTVDRSLPIPADPAVGITVPSFLDADQKRLYQEAYTLYSHLFGPATSAIDEWEWSGSEPLPPAEPVEVDGYTYSPATGYFANWKDLESAALSVFTPGFFQARNTWLDNHGNPHQTFVNVDGRTYYLDGARGSSGYNENFPETFHLMRQSETELSFVMTGYYSQTLPLEGESPEERDARLKANWEEYIGFPMKLVLTEDGWRFDEFHCAWTDNALMPYVNQAAPNPALTDDPRPKKAGACAHGLDCVYEHRLTDGRLVFRCMEDWFPYYPPYPCAYNTASTGTGDYDGDGHIEQAVINSAGTLMLCDIVDGELKTFTFTPRIDAYPGADLSTAWLEPGDELILYVPLRDEPNGTVGTVELRLYYDGTALTHGEPVPVTTQEEPQMHPL